MSVECFDLCVVLFAAFMLVHVLQENLNGVHCLFSFLIA